MVATSSSSSVDALDDQFALTVAAWQAAQIGKHDEAVALLERVLLQAPNDPVALTTLASVYREMGRLRDAILTCDAAIAAAPGHAAAWLERGFVLTSGGSLDAAFDCYAQVANLDPHNAPAHAGMAAIAGRRGDTDTARRHATTALVVDPDNAIAICALAAVEIENGDTQSAINRLTRLVDGSAGATPERVLAYNLLGDAFDRIDATADAFAAYARGKAAFAKIHAPQFAKRTQTHLQFVQMISDGIHRLGPKTDWALPSHQSAPRHVFLLGYPRSGTTLVENILASLPGARALEERPTLRDADEAFLSDPTGLEHLADLTTDLAAPFRDAYWSRVANARAMPPQDGVFIDMDPLKATRLPIILRLFPNASILIMRRDPRDVVWSCFRTNFALTNAADEFTDLVRTAHHYAAMMHLIDQCITQYPIRTHIIRYDRIVHDFDAETKKICDFIGVAWTAAVRDFNKTAQSRGVSTASASQVRKPLYDGTRQWERYAKHLAPVLPILQPWVEKFGFDS